MRNRRGKAKSMKNSFPKVNNTSPTRENTIMQRAITSIPPAKLSRYNPILIIKISAPQFELEILTDLSLSLLCQIKYRDTNGTKIP
jgi:hypothetical protein